MLNRVALNQMTLKNVERILAQGEPSEAALVSMQHEVEEEAEQPLLLLAERGRRSELDVAMQAIQSGDYFPESPRPGSGFLNRLHALRVPGVATRVRANLLKFHNQLVTKRPNFLMNNRCNVMNNYAQLRRGFLNWPE